MPSRVFLSPRFVLFLALFVCFSRLASFGETVGNAYLDFVVAEGRRTGGSLAVPVDGAGVEKLRRMVRVALADAWTGWPENSVPLDARVVGVVEREGYRVEKVLFETFPGVWMTANLYLPVGKGPFPAVLSVHGHWPGAKQDPVVQARCIGLVRLGFVVLAVDAFGAGERGVGTALGEYHGEMTAATLFPVGLPLSGLQVYENMRAIDYLQQRPEVDGGRIGITGASGGGNQSMYAGAFDERIGAVASVCSVGTYESYLGAACCLCEVVPGLLRVTEEWGVLSLIAPKGMLVINASRDARQFSIAEALKSVGKASDVFAFMGARERIRHASFESGHDYSQPMRETVYGWMSWILNRSGDGGKIPEPALRVEIPEDLRCFPGDSRPEDWVTIPRFAAREGRRLLRERSKPEGATGWETWARGARERLRAVLGVGDGSGRSVAAAEVAGVRMVFESEPGIQLVAELEPGGEGKGVVVVLDLEGGKRAREHGLSNVLRAEGMGVVTLDLRATGALAWPNDRIGRAVDHNTAEWGLWIGRPLLGQWVVDVRGLLDALERHGLAPEGGISLAGIDGAGLVAMAAGALDGRVRGVAAIGTLASYVTDAPYVGQRLGLMVPGIVREVGDVGDVASLLAPRRLVVAGGVDGQGVALGGADLELAYARGVSAWESHGKGGEFLRRESVDVDWVARALAR